MHQFAFLDWAVISVYFASLAGIVWWSSRKQNSSKDYFLAGRNLGWFVIGCSLFASNIGSEHLVGLAGAGATSGVAMAHYELHAWCLLVLGWVLVPFYYRSGVFTMPEFLERRYNSASRWILSIISLVAYVFTKVSVTVFAGGLVCKTLMPELIWMGIDSFWLGALGTVILTGIYTVFGGLRAVAYTDAIQAIVLIVGSLFITVIGLNKLGGWGELRATVEPSFLNMWRPASDPDFPWHGMLFAAPIVGLWYWCTDQYIVQRTLAARNLKIARQGTIFASYLKITPVFLFIVPGMIAYALAKKNMLIMETPDQAYPALVQQLLPVGIRGLVVGGLLSALMSSLSSLFNSCSSIFTLDIYKKLKPDTPEKKLVLVGRIATVAVVILGILWIPIMKMISGALYQYLQSVQAYLGPPLTAVFFLGVFWKRLNGQGAVATMGIGFFLGLAKLGCQIYANSLSPEAVQTASALATLVISFGSINFLMFAVYLFLICCAILIGVSYATPPPNEKQIENLTFGTMTDDKKKEQRATWGKWEVIHTVVVLSLILGVYIYFSG